MGIEESSPGRPAAAAAIWSWQPDEVEVDPDEALGRARRKGAIQGLVGLMVAGALAFFVSQTVGAIVATIAGIILLCALVSPGGLYAGIDALFLRLAHYVGLATTWLLLVPIFYLFFLPFGALLRRGKRDRLHRFYEPDRESYWTDRGDRALEREAWERQY